MNFISFSKIALLSAMAAFAVSTGYHTDLEAGAISSITLALDTKGDEREPVNPSDVFLPTDTIHAVVRIVDAPANTNLRASWYVVDVGDAAEPGTLIFTNDISTDGTRNIDFSLKPTAEFPVGTYRVDVLVNGLVDTTKNFSIRAK